MCSDNKYWQDRYPTILERMQYIYKQKLFTDFLLIVKDNETIKEFKVHKMFLASSSPYFESALFGPFSTESDSMVLDDVDCSAFEDLLGYMYTDKHLFRNTSQALNIYNLADRFLMENIKNMCRSFLVADVNQKNVFHITENFQLLNDPTVLSACQKVIKRHTTAIILSKEFEQICLETLLMILSIDKLKIKSELQLYKAAERWLESQISQKEIVDESVKKKLFYNVMENIRFRSMSADEFPLTAMLNKYMDTEDRQKIFKCISSGNDADLMPGNFSQKKRDFYSDDAPKQSVEVLYQALPPDWRQRLHASVVRGDIRRIRNLIRAGADVNVKYYNGTTLLHIAAHRCKTEIVSFLIDQGLPVNTIDGCGYTALHIAALWGKSEVVQLLLETGADPALTNTEGQTPLDIANAQPHNCHQEIRDILTIRSRHQ